MAYSEIDLLNLLDQLQITCTLYRHQPLHTVEESQGLRGTMPGGHCKCLFVKDKKARFGLFVVDENQPVDLKDAAKAFGLGRLSFAKPETMMDMLGVTPGAVTPFALVNVPKERVGEIVVVLDAAMLKASPLHYHPLHNEATIAITADDLLLFLGHLGFSPVIHEF
jgi:Ala-tRNA(Pro) deacylase